MTLKFYVKNIYSNFLKDAFNIDKIQNIAWDSGNGATSEIIKTIYFLFKWLPKSIILRDRRKFSKSPSRSFRRKKLKRLKKSVLKNKCDFGIAFDGDGDRIGIVDNLGRTVPGDLILLLL